MRERPILWSAPMVLALLAGRKTQTRRIVKLRPDGAPPPWAKHVNTIENADHLGHLFQWSELEHDPPRPLRRWPADGYARGYCKVGERLWGRETFVYREKHDRYYYRADSKFDPYAHNGWKPSIFMPRKASRLLHEVTSVRVEQLLDISDDDAIAEGLLERDGDERHERLWAWPGSESLFESPRACYWAGWDTINGSGSAAKNPWVWVISFKPVKA